MFAVIKTGGKQYKVSKDDIVAVERLAADAGETVQFNEVLMLGGDKTTVGSPLIDGAAVQAEVVEQGRGEKVLNFKRRRRKHSSKRLKGHRQYITTIKVTDILASSGDKSGVKAALGAASAGAMVAAGAVAAAPKKAKKAEAPAAPKPEKKAEPEAAPVKVKDKETSAKVEPAAKAEDAAPTESTRPSNLLDAPQGEPDDLTKISGVGPVLNKKLNENGVYHFWQIAQWGPSEIAFMDDQLSFKGRIERDEWIAQA
jgi:large subunit ribosomal protein L21